LNVLQSLHDHRRCSNYCEACSGGGNKILGNRCGRPAKSPEAIRGIRNLVIITKILGSMDPEVLKKFTEAVPNALAGAAKAQENGATRLLGILPHATQ